MDDQMNTQSILCRVGWHSWSRWEKKKENIEDTTNSCMGGMSTYTTTSHHVLIYIERSCWCCGLIKVKKVKS